MAYMCHVGLEEASNKSTGGPAGAHREPCYHVITGCWSPTWPPFDLPLDYYGPLVAFLSMLVCCPVNGPQTASIRGTEVERH